MRDDMNNFTEEFYHQYTIETSVENLWVCLRDKFHDLLKHFVTHKNLQNNHQQSWITHDILNILGEGNNLLIIVLKFSSLATL